mmetsp:Transcript_15901/g.37948  ORF Transcript_15901/g.37948 Transcript_15901/m.37948 type:complete len:102 (+) Transcript_15901:267-572(+)
MKNHTKWRLMAKLLYNADRLFGLWSLSRHGAAIDVISTSPGVSRAAAVGEGVIKPSRSCSCKMSAFVKKYIRLIPLTVMSTKAQAHVPNMIVNHTVPRAYI